MAKRRDDAMIHKAGCPCVICSFVASGMTREAARAAYHSQYGAKMAKYGWVVHLVTSGDEQTASGYNVHTHGVRESFGSPDLQIAYPLAPETAHMILRNLVAIIRNGAELQHGRQVSKVIGNGYLVRLVNAVEGSRQVLRVIIPGKDGKLMPEDIDLRFRHQYLNLGAGAEVIQGETICLINSHETKVN